MIFKKIAFYLIIIIMFTPTLAIGFQDDPGQVYSAQFSQFMITNVEPVEFFPGDARSLNITIKNIRQNSAFDVTFSMNPQNADILKTTGGLTRSFEGEFYPNQTYTIQYNIYVRNDVISGVYYIPINIKWYSVESGRVYRQDDINLSTIGIRIIDNPEAPKLDVFEIHTPDRILPGDTFPLTLKIMNRGEKATSSLILALSLSPPLSSIGSDTEEYLSSLDPNSTADINFNISIDKNAVSKLYPINYSLQYYDDKNRLKTSNNYFGINISEVSKVYVQDISLQPPAIEPGDDGILLLQIANAGTSPIKNVRIVISGARDLLAQTNNYIGEIAPGGVGSSTFGVFIDPTLKKGTYGMTIQVSYDDTYGHRQSLLYVYPIKVVLIPIIPISMDTLLEIFYILIFILASYVIFLIRGSRLVKSQKRSNNEKN